MKAGVNAPLNRRTAIHAGALGLMGLSMSDLARLQAETDSPHRAKSVIYVFLSGGLGSTRELRYEARGSQGNSWDI